MPCATSDARSDSPSSGDPGARTGNRPDSIPPGRGDGNSGTLPARPSMTGTPRRFDDQSAIS